MTDSLVTPGGNPERLTVCVVSHTHWDREWYHSASRFRQGLVALVDALFVPSQSGAFPFVLDGQAVVLEDYLAVRPEMADRLGVALRSGDIEAGPWYVLADGLIPSGEAIVRNLLAGRRVLRRFGALAPAVAYCPDTFGHSAAIPEIARGFGFPLAMVWRGYGGARWPAGDVAQWRSASGGSVLLYHLPPDGYETGSALPTAHAHVVDRWHSFRTLMATRSSTGVVLWPNGADHHALQPDIREAVHALHDVAAPDVVVRESLGGFARRVVQAAESRAEVLPVVEGELRDSYGYTWTLGGTFATRAEQKRANAKAERLLLRDVEPWMVLAWLHGGHAARETARDGRITLAQAPALLDSAWRTLLRAHPHDTLCGCSIDAVARAMNGRIESVVSQARGLRQAALGLALRHDVAAARRAPLRDSAQVVVRNRCARWRGGVAEVLLDETVRDVPVGPSSAGASPDTISDLVGGTPRLDVGGHPLQLVGSRLVYRRRESPQHYPDNDLVREHRALVWLPPVPPVGLAVIPCGLAALGSDTSAALGHLATDTNAALGHVGSDTKAALGHEGSDTKRNIPQPAAVRIGNAHEVELTNGHLAVFVGKDAVRITQGDRTLQNVLTFESTNDVGDSYTPAIRGEPELLRIVSVKAGLPGPLRATVALVFATAKKRSGVRLRGTLVLDANADVLRIDIAGNNQRRNHRLRVSFNTDVVARDVSCATWADAAFGPVARVPINVPAADQVREMVPLTTPMHRWTTMSGATSGATLHADGLAEVEANETTGIISLTLVRAIGELSRADLPERPGHAGWPAPIPMAQSLGVFHARIALQLHASWSQPTRDEIENASDAFLLPLVAETMRDLLPAAPSVVGPELRGTALRTSAITLADDGDGIVLRCTNDSTNIQHGVWSFPTTAALEFALARLDETRESEWTGPGHEFAFVAAPRAVVTVRARRSAN